MSILSEHLPLVNEHIAVQEKLARKFAPGTKAFNEYRHSLHVSNCVRFKALHEVIEQADKLLDELPARASMQTSQLTLAPEELEGLPPELLSELSEGAVPDKSETALVNAIKERGGVATLDQLLVGLYRVTGEVMKRSTLTSKLYRLSQKGVLFNVPNRKGVYSIAKLSPEEAARLFGDDSEPVQETLALR
jgi:hypothetical protein